MARLVLSQMLVGGGTQLVAALGPLMVLALARSPLLSGLSIAILGVTRFAAYPFGRFGDRYGRVPGLYVGLLIAAFGTVAIGLAMEAGSFPAFVVGLVTFAIGMNGVQQLRLAAAEMFPPDRRALVVGIMLTGSLAGAATTPLLVAASEQAAPALDLSALALPWFVLPLVLAPSALLLRGVRPDPTVIAASLDRYYPALDPSEAGEADVARFGLREFWRDRTSRIAATTMFGAQSSMQTAMVTVPLLLGHHGQTLTAISIAVAIHVSGMFAPSIPLGHIADRFGRHRVLVTGLVVEAVGAVTAASATEYWPATLGIFLVGVGWCGASVATTAMVVDVTAVPARGRAIGILDAIGGAGVVFPLSVGPVVAIWGVQMAGALAVVLVALPVPFLAADLLSRPASAPRSAHPA